MRWRRTTRPTSSGEKLRTHHTRQGMKDDRSIMSVLDVLRGV